MKEKSKFDIILSYKEKNIINKKYLLLNENDFYKFMLK